MKVSFSIYFNQFCPNNINNRCTASYSRWKIKPFMYLECKEKSHLLQHKKNPKVTECLCESFCPKWQKGYSPDRFKLRIFWYCVETLKARSNMWKWQMFSVFSWFSPITSSHAAVGCSASCSSCFAGRHLHLTHCFFLSFPSHLSPLTHTHRSSRLMTDG